MPVCRNSGTCRNCLAGVIPFEFLAASLHLWKLASLDYRAQWKPHDRRLKLHRNVTDIQRSLWPRRYVLPRLAELTRGNIQMQSIAQTQCVWYRGVTGDEGGDSDCDSDGHVMPLTGCDHSSSAESLSADEPTAPSDAYRYQRRRSRAVLYQLSGTYRNKRSTASKLQLRKVCTRDSLILTR